ncbi:succinate dehydrogenase [bacterium]|nr:succinate dehydrogenase [bacterium]
MTTSTLSGGYREGLGATQRTDRWWIEPLWTGVGFLLFVLYANWAAFQGNHYFYGGYLSPFFSPVLFTDPTVAGAAPVEHAWFGVWPDWLRAIWPSFMPTSPAWLILAGPLSFRLTCYYYRKFYYRAYFLTPPACAVGARSQQSYRGETLLFLFQNLHRYALYIAIAYIFVLSYDAYLAFWRDGRFGIGLGTIILLLNPILLGSYTFGCHSFRHLVGGRLNCFSCDGASQARHGAWQRVSWLNQRHMLFAWMSLVWVGFCDFYVRMVSMGYIHDPSTWG